MTSNESPIERYIFDGKTNSVIVPAKTVKQVIPEKFTLSFSMKHAAGTKDEQKEKQNILCETDDLSKFKMDIIKKIDYKKMDIIKKLIFKNGYYLKN